MLLVNILIFKINNNNKYLYKNNGINSYKNIYKIKICLLNKFKMIIFIINKSKLNNINIKILNDKLKLI